MRREYVSHVLYAGSILSGDVRNAEVEWLVIDVQTVDSKDLSENYYFIVPLGSEY